MRQLFYMAAAALMLTACSDNGTDIVPSAVDTKPWPYTANMDTTVAPGDNFFMYCIGTWYKNCDLDGKPYWGLVRGESQAYIAQYTKAMDSPAIATFWADSAKIDQTTDAARLAVDKMMAMTEQIQTREDAWKVLADLMEQGYTPLFHLYLYSKSSVYYALLDKTNIDSVMVTPASLLKVAGFSDRKAKETVQLASQVQEKLSKSRPDVDLSPEYLDTHPEVQNGILPLSSMKTRNTGYAFLDIILHELGIDESQVFVDQSLISYYQQIANLTAAEIKAYLQMHISQDYLYTSHQTISQYNQTAATKVSLAGLMNDFYTTNMNYIASYDYATHTVSAAEKADMVSKCKEMIAVCKERIQALDWMSATTKAKAITKLDKMVFNVGYPDNWIEAGLPTLAGHSLVEDVMTIRKANFNAQKSIIGKTVEEQSFNVCMLRDGNNLNTDNAAYYPSENSIIIYPIYLKKPYYSTEYSDAYNYAMIGSCIGHEITHAFDADGSKRDELGNYKNWWTVADKMEYQDREQKLIDCYNQLEVLPDELPNVYNNGTMTLNENIADLGGMLLAYQAYMQKLAKEGYSGDELVKQEKKYFQAYGEVWRGKYNTLAANLYKTNVHSLPKERVNGVVMNIDRWYELYDVKFGNILYLKPEKRAYIW